MTIKSLLFGLLALCTLPALSVCPEMEIWSDGTNYRYLIKDCHRDYIDGRVSTKQQNDIIWAAQHLKAQGVFILAEDSSTYCGFNKKIQNYFNQFIHKTLRAEIIAKWWNKIDVRKAIGSLEIVEATPLTCLISACQTSGILAYNTECSHAKDVVKHAHVFPAATRITMQEAIADLSEHMAEIGSNPWLKKRHAQFIQQLDALKKIASQNNKNEEEFSKKFGKIRHVLVSSKTIHKLCEWNKVKHGFICEGQTHIEQIKAGLTALKYTKIKSVGDARLWALPVSEQTHKQMLHNALDLSKIFTQFFAQEKEIAKQKEQQLKSALAYVIKSPENDMPFLNSSHGQKYLAETAMADATQTTVTTAVTTSSAAAPMDMSTTSLAATAQCTSAAMMNNN